MALRITLLLSGVLILLVSGLLVWHLSDKRSVESAARKAARDQAVVAASQIDAELARLVTSAESLARDISSGNLLSAEIELSG